MVFNFTRASAHPVGKDNDLVFAQVGNGINGRVKHGVEPSAKGGKLRISTQRRADRVIVRITNKFKAEVMVEKEDEQVNGKSIMGLMMLAAAKGECIKIITDGADAAQAMDALGALVASGFGDVE